MKQTPHAQKEQLTIAKVADIDFYCTELSMKRFEGEGKQPEGGTVLQFPQEEPMFLNERDTENFMFCPNTHKVILIYLKPQNEKRERAPRK